jgi:predicted lipid-binding transport protein (Tim44 family)
MEGFQFFEILVLALFAGFLVHRLRSVLGRRTGHERRRDPFGTAANAHRRSGAKDDDNVIQLPGQGEGEELAGGTLDASSPLEAGLVQIKVADPHFRDSEFLAGAQAAFEMIVHAFAAGDTDTLRNLLSDDVYRNFADAITARERAGEQLESKLLEIETAEMIEAQLEKRTIATVTVKFVTQQINVTRDKSGEIVDGDPNDPARITDIWTFARDTRSTDPNWMLVATRSPN